MRNRKYIKLFEEYSYIQMSNLQQQAYFYIHHIFVIKGHKYKINTVKDMKEQILKIAKDLEQGSISENNAQALLLGLFDVRRSYSLDEVREIALEYRNSCMYGHSHKLTRFELQAELRKIDEKHGLDYKEGVDYNFA